MTYQRWNGVLSIRTGDTTLTTHSLLAWFPAPAPAAAVKEREDAFHQDQPLFPSAARLKVRVGPLKVTVSLALAFKGSIEYWRVPG